jgi:hypothetical protein
MTAWKEPTVAAARRKLRQSMELSYYLKNLVVFSLIYLVAGGMAVLSSGTAQQPTMWLTMGIMLAVFYAPLLGFFLWRIIQIFRKPEEYIFCRTTLSQPHAGIFRNTMNFSVLLELPDGTRRTRTTHSIFMTHGLTVPLLEDYINREVTLGYNEETETVVVIG